MRRGTLRSQRPGPCRGCSADRELVTGRSTATVRAAAVLTAQSSSSSRDAPREAPSVQWGARPQMAQNPRRWAMHTAKEWQRRAPVSSSAAQSLGQTLTRPGWGPWVNLHVPVWQGCPPVRVSSASGGRLSTQRPSPASWGWRPRSAQHVRCPEPSVGSCSRPGGHDLPSLPGKHSREAMVSESACPKWLLSFSTYLFYCWPWKHTEGFGWVKNSGWKLFPFWLRRGIPLSFACRSCCWETQNLVGSTLWANFPTSKITAWSLLYCPAPWEEPWRGLLFIPVLDIHRALLIPQPTPFISEKCPCFLLLLI